MVVDLIEEEVTCVPSCCRSSGSSKKLEYPLDMSLISDPSEARLARRRSGTRPNKLCFRSLPSSRWIGLSNEKPESAVAGWKIYTRHAASGCDCATPHRKALYLQLKIFQPCKQNRLYTICRKRQRPLSRTRRISSPIPRTQMSPLRLKSRTRSPRGKHGLRSRCGHYSTRSIQKVCVILYRLCESTVVARTDFPVMDGSGDKIEWKAVSEVVGRDWKVSVFFAGCLERRVADSHCLIEVL